MATEKFERTKPHVNVGTIGHVDHGKTTLRYRYFKCASFTGNKVRLEKIEDIDNAPEEKARGITIALHHSEYETAKRHYAHTLTLPDTPIISKNMITFGAAQWTERFSW